jgi:hypothetical protein
LVAGSSDGCGFVGFVEAGFGLSVVCGFFGFAEAGFTVELAEQPIVQLQLGI